MLLHYHLLLQSEALRQDKLTCFFRRRCCSRLSFLVATG